MTQIDVITEEQAKRLARDGNAVEVVDGTKANGYTGKGGRSNAGRALRKALEENADRSLGLLESEDGSWTVVEISAKRSSAEQDRRNAVAAAARENARLAAERKAGGGQTASERAMNTSRSRSRKGEARRSRKGPRKSAREFAIEVLANGANSPLKCQPLATAMKASGWTGGGKTPHQVVSGMVQQAPEFVRAGKGTWRLTKRAFKAAQTA